MLHPVILCGGSGTRLWPLSRQALPKQFLPLLSNRSLLQDTALRLQGLHQLAPALVVCNTEHRFLVADQLLEVSAPLGPILLEPAGRNTAPAVAMAAHLALQSDPEALLLVLPSDHIIRDGGAFRASVEAARALACSGCLMTFGIVPDAPETGYGYIERGEALDEDAFRVRRFVEKPDAERAAQFLESGNFLWNSGMFLLPAKLYLDELDRHAPEVALAAARAIEGGQADIDFLRPDTESFLSSPSISIDYAVMEHTESAAVVPARFGWSDIGSYDALWKEEQKDAHGNATQGEVVIHDSRGCYVHTEKQMVALLGVEDLVVIATADAILVTPKSRSQDVKTIVDELKKQGRSEPEIHKQVFRPWGWYEGVEQGERFQVKQLMVKPGAKTSMQVHHHRSEHWVIVKGTAQITLDGEDHLLSEDKSIYVPLGVPHRIFNPGRIPLHLVEVQSGSYLEEDDIVRLDDNYGR
jgi:mannose-1-phosphate guanylyltransferase/mannose-6-phosphate isomerase